MRLYGSLNNRVEENHNYLKRPIRVGDDLTEYLWSDRHAYYVTRVIDQKHIFVKPYLTCADQEKAGGMGHQNWMYFKTIREHNEYLNRFFPNQYATEGLKEPSEIELAYKWGAWRKVVRSMYGRQLPKPKYPKMNVSFGVREYFYDWSF